MIEVTSKIIEYTEEGVEYQVKEYEVTSSYPNSLVKILIDKLKNQTYTDEDGVATITTMNTDEHTLKVTIQDETITTTQ